MPHRVLELTWYVITQVHRQPIHMLWRLFIVGVCISNELKLRTFWHYHAGVTCLLAVCERKVLYIPPYTDIRRQVTSRLLNFCYKIIFDTLPYKHTNSSESLGSLWQDHFKTNLSCMKKMQVEKKINSLT